MSFGHSLTALRGPRYAVTHVFKQVLRALAKRGTGRVDLHAGPAVPKSRISMSFNDHVGSGLSFFKRESGPCPH
jgi:hypothetical protein